MCYKKHTQRYKVKNAHHKYSKYFTLEFVCFIVLHVEILILSSSGFREDFNHIYSIIFCYSVTLLEYFKLRVFSFSLLSLSESNYF